EDDLVAVKIAGHFEGDFAALVLGVLDLALHVGDRQRAGQLALVELQLDEHVQRLPVHLGGVLPRAGRVGLVFVFGHDQTGADRHDNDCYESSHRCTSLASERWEKTRDSLWALPASGRCRKPSGTRGGRRPTGWTPGPARLAGPTRLRAALACLRRAGSRR